MSDAEINSIDRRVARLDGEYDSLAMARVICLLAGRLDEDDLDAFERDLREVCDESDGGENAAVARRAHSRVCLVKEFADGLAQLTEEPPSANGQGKY